ncbi:hypothetical protein ABIB17_003953, partial [Arthrobacter sp. UYEF6]
MRSLCQLAGGVGLCSESLPGARVVGGGLIMMDGWYGNGWGVGA